MREIRLRVRMIGRPTVESLLHVCSLFTEILVWTTKFDMATWPFLKFDMRHVTGGLKMLMTCYRNNS